MRTLVTGGAGFIGANLVNRLVDEGNEVIIFDNLSTGSQYNINKEAKLFLKYPTKEVSFEDDDVLYGTHEGGDGTEWLSEFTKAWKKEINIPIHLPQSPPKTNNGIVGKYNKNKIIKTLFNFKILKILLVLRFEL